ncbi:hypothetical protein [Streptacidiphilus neutrinimicus]|uniref:hypothetical protein n=1 Tax=Streptacidiphilus neutrinimicus TaxID=105420 RepID=UPI0012699654|nr:hypothetical protein [Streptacidiphilus neutrinimicus]
MDGFRVDTDPLQSLREFTVRVDYGREHTTFLVYQAGRSEPVVRMHKDYPHTVDVRPYYVHHRAHDYVHPGADPRQLLGYVKLGKAWDAQQAEIGAIGAMAKRGHMDRGPVVQHGLGTLTPQRQPLTGKKRGVRAVLAFIDDFSSHGILGDQGREDAMFSAHVRCTGPTSAGFELVRRAGVTATYEVVVHDPQLSRLLVLAYVECFSHVSDGDLRQNLVGLATNPFRDRNKAEHRRMKLEKEQREGR